MFSHVVLGAKDLGAAKTFYDATLGALGVGEGMDAGSRVIWATKTGNFIATHPINGEPACHANGGTVGFAATSPEQVDAFHAAGIAAGGTAIEDPPGIRQMGKLRLYLGYLRDPSGNKICAMHTLPREA